MWLNSFIIIDDDDCESVGYIIPRISTARIGPIEQRATRPKLSDFALLSLRIEATPTPRAIMKGTVIGPVVTPPESNATERKLLSENADNTNTSA